MGEISSPPPPNLPLPPHKTIDPTTLLTPEHARMRANTHDSELCVSSRLSPMGEMLTNMSVLALPPRESDISIVSLWLRYGMCPLLVARAEMTSPSAERDLLMDCASFSCSPADLLFFTRSEPARSTKESWREARARGREGEGGGGIEKKQSGGKGGRDQRDGGGGHSAKIGTLLPLPTQLGKKPFPKY